VEGVARFLDDGAIGISSRCSMDMTAQFCALRHIHCCGTRVFNLIQALLNGVFLWIVRVRLQQSPGMFVDRDHGI